MFQPDISGNKGVPPFKCTITELKSMKSVSNLSSEVYTHALDRERRGLREGARIKSLSCSFRGFRFDSSIRVRSHSCSSVHFQRIQHPLLISGHRTHLTHIHTHAGQTLLHIQQITLKRERSVFVHVYERTFVHCVGVVREREY